MNCLSRHVIYTLRMTRLYFWCSFKITTFPEALPEEFCHWLVGKTHHPTHPSIKVQSMIWMIKRTDRSLWWNVLETEIDRLTLFLCMSMSTRTSQWSRAIESYAENIIIEMNRWTLMVLDKADFGNEWIFFFSLLIRVNCCFTSLLMI